MLRKLKLRGVAHIRLALILTGVFFSAASHAQLTVVLISNYDAKLTISGELHHISGQAKVRSGRTFPIEFQDHRIDVSVNYIGDGKYRAFVNVFEKHFDDSWSEITIDPLSFEALYAAPVQFQWQSDNVSMDLAIAISIYQR
jgi:hypothetical protein